MFCLHNGWDQADYEEFLSDYEEFVSKGKAGKDICGGKKVTDLTDMYLLHLMAKPAKLSQLMAKPAKPTKAKAPSLMRRPLKAKAAKAPSECKHWAGDQARGLRHVDDVAVAT